MLEKGFCLIPNIIMYDKELNDKQKLLYGVITSLCAEKGYCRASNKYIGDLLNCKEWSISQNISKLKDKGYINIRIESDYKRAISLVNNQNTCEKSQGGMGNFTRGVCEKSQEINIIDNINNNISDLELKKSEVNNHNLNKIESNDDLVNIDGDLTFDKIVNKFYKKSGHKIDLKKSEKLFNQKGFTKAQKELILLDMNIFKIEYKYGIKEQMYRPGFDRYIEGLNLDDLQRDYRLKNIAKYHIENTTNGIDRAKVIKDTLSEEQFDLFKKQCKAVQTKDLTKLLNLKK